MSPLPWSFSSLTGNGDSWLWSWGQPWNSHQPHPLALAPRSLLHELLKPSTHLHCFSHAHLANCMSFLLLDLRRHAARSSYGTWTMYLPPPTELRSPDVVPMLYPPGRCFIKADEKEHLKGPREEKLLWITLKTNKKGTPMAENQKAALGGGEGKIGSLGLADRNYST